MEIYYSILLFYKIINSGEDYCPYCDSYCNEECDCFCHDGYEEFERQNYYYIGNNRYYPENLRDSENDYTNKINEISKDEELSEYFNQPKVAFNDNVEKLETIKEVDSNVETISTTINNKENQYKVIVRPKRRKDDLKPFNPHVGHKFTPLTYEETQRRNQEVLFHFYFFIFCFYLLLNRISLGKEENEKN